jgi:hypothetical protein
MSEETKKCRFCGEEILAVAIKCKHCGSNLSENVSAMSTTSRPAADYGMLLLAIPVIATLLIWFWVSGMNLFQAPAQTMALIMLATVLITAIVAATEAKKVGMESNRDEGTYSATAWFFLIVFLWVICYPAYLFKRRKYGLANYLVIGILVTVIFVGSWGVMSAAIENKVSNVQGNLKNIQQRLSGVPDTSVKTAPVAEATAQPIPQTQTKPEVATSKSDVAADSDVTKPVSDILQNDLIQQRFRAMLGVDYPKFRDNFQVILPPQSADDWFFASGCAQHMCGESEAAFAINKRTAETFAGLLANGKPELYAPKKWTDLPPPLFKWYEEKGGK